MSSHFQLDSHKLHYHPRLVADFLEGKDISPLNVEVSLTDGCNHRCLFCNFNYLGHQRVSLPLGRMPRLVEELAEGGVKTLTFAGAGEPLLHPDLFPSLHAGRQFGLELAMSTNGVLLKSEHIAEIPNLLTWIRFSINGGTPESYAAVHRCQPGDFAKVMGNLSRLAEEKYRSNSAVTLGTQCVLLDDNYRDIPQLAREVREAGADYFVVKHFYPREESDYHPDLTFRSETYLDELAALAADMSSGSFSMVVRDAGKLNRQRPYQSCLGLPFIVYIGEDGLLYTCFSHHDDVGTAIGSLLEHDFLTLWHSAGKAAAIHHLNSQYDKNLCQANCRHHQINMWLHQLKNPPAHVNFV